MIQKYKPKGKENIMTNQMIFSIGWIIVPVVLWVIYFSPNKWWKATKGKAFPYIAIYSIGTLLLSMVNQKEGIFWFSLLFVFVCSFLLIVSIDENDINDEEKANILGVVIPIIATLICMINLQHQFIEDTTQTDVVIKQSVKKTE